MTVETVNADEVAWPSNTLAPQRFWAPLISPSSPGLWGCTTWFENTGPSRFLESGLQIRPVGNYSDDLASGVWSSPWCVDPGSDEFDLKTGVREDPNTVPFQAITTWAFDSCSPEPATRDEVRTRVQQIHRMREPIMAERSFSATLLARADVIASAPDLTAALGYLEGALAETNSLGVIHASAQWTSPAAQAMLLVGSGSAPKTPARHAWCFGGGYVKGLSDVLVATSPVYGWRDQVVLREVPLTAEDSEVFAVIAERSLVIGVEKVIAAVSIAGESA
ncbi:hypothetical protein [Mycobacterium sp.]|uniref:hypothetical protein n=1 Tax=Mycobacterium sp. TaxID=1785 RepID=UPI003F9D6604